MDSTRATHASSPTSPTSSPVEAIIPTQILQHAHPEPPIPIYLPTYQQDNFTFAKVWDRLQTELHQVPGADFQGPPQDVVEMMFACFLTPWEVTLPETVRTWKVLETLEGASWAFPVETYEDTLMMRVHFQGFEILWQTHFPPTAPHCVELENSLTPNWLPPAEVLDSPRCWTTRKIATWTLHWNEVFNA